MDNSWGGGIFVWITIGSMKRIFLSAFTYLSLFVWMSSQCHAQDSAAKSDANTAYNQGLTAYEKSDLNEALANFEKAFQIAETTGTRDFNISIKCKMMIPKVLLDMGKANLDNRKCTEAARSIQYAAEMASMYGNQDVAKEARDLYAKTFRKIVNPVNATIKGAEITNVITTSKYTAIQIRIFKNNGNKNLESISISQNTFICIKGVQHELLSADGIDLYPGKNTFDSDKISFTLYFEPFNKIKKFDLIISDGKSSRWKINGTWSWYGVKLMPSDAGM